jgi:hypothetical protein
MDGRLGEIMTNEDLLNCPLLQGLDAMHRAELLGLINDSGLKEKMEKCLAEQRAKTWTDPEPANVEPAPRNFSKNVHSWNPKQLVFSRSPKE